LKELSNVPRWQKDWNEAQRLVADAKSPLEELIALSDLKSIYSKFVETAAFVSKAIVAHHYASINNPRAEAPVDLQKVSPSSLMSFSSLNFINFY
jgi:hypothetical protein